MFGGNWPRAQTPAEIPEGPLDALARWSAEQPERLIYSFLGDKGELVASLSYAQLEARSDNLARYLRFTAKLEVGARALLVYPPGLDFIVAYLACLRAGVIAVPAFPPEPTRLSKDLTHFTATQASCGAKVALTNTLYSHAKKLAGLAQLIKRDGGKWPELQWIVTDSIGSNAPAGTLERPPPSAVAFLQYTSGSTAEPKGVRITHANLAHNIRWIVLALGVDRNTVELSWLPQYHDMGLIGAYLGLLGCGGEGHYLSPFSFVRDATLWPRLLSDKKATHTQAPSFAYALAARKWDALESKNRPVLRLSALKHMVNGAEPIDPEAIEAFVKAFSPFGLRREAIVPTYGLAEHTVFVCTGGKQVLSISRTQMQEQRLATTVSHGSPGAIVAVGCGAPPEGSGIVVRIVDPDRCVGLATLKPSTMASAAAAAIGTTTPVGEVWLQSSSVADGYWAGEDGLGPLAQLSAETFGAVVAGEEASGVRYLRTGDLGFVENGELFLCGRQKDLLIIGGRNHYPQDLERAAERAVSELRPGCCAVFSVSLADAAASRSALAQAMAQGAQGGAELIVVVAELRTEANSRAEEVASRVAAAISAAHSVPVHCVALIKQGTLFKTKSGKVSRSRTKADFLGTSESPLAVVHGLAAPTAVEADAAEPSAPGAPSASGAATSSTAAAHPVVDVGSHRSRSVKDLTAELRTRIAFEANLPEASLDVTKPLVTMGVGSMELVQIRGMLQTLYGLDFEESVLATDQATVTKIAQAIKAGAIPEAMAKAAVVLPPADGTAGVDEVAVAVRQRQRAGPPCCSVQ